MSNRLTGYTPTEAATQPPSNIEGNEVIRDGGLLRYFGRHELLV